MPAFAALRHRPLLRDALVLILSALGMGLCITACVLAWRVLAKSGKPRSSRRPGGKAARMS